MELEDFRESALRAAVDIDRKKPTKSGVHRFSTLLNSLAGPALSDEIELCSFMFDVSQGEGERPKVVDDLSNILKKWAGEVQALSDVGRHVALRVHQAAWAREMEKFPVGW